MTPQRISILGVGLLGGSLGLAARAAVSNCEIVGYGHRPETLRKAVEVGAIDRGTRDLREAVEGADVVVLCTPVGLFGSILKDIGGQIPASSVVTDVGSTKRSVVAEARRHLLHPGTFVGSHPMAGSEKRGVEFARADLFHGALCITTPTEQSNPAAVERVEQFWRTVGMRVTRLTPEEHDRLLADVSHLPHTVAAALVAMQEERGLDLSGKGFLDTTRIAGGDGGLWRDILLDNRDHLEASIRRVQGELDRVVEMVRAGDGEGLRHWLDAAAARREELVKRKLRELHPG